MLWLSSLVTGTANDAFFMMLPIVDNFWQVSLPKKIKLNENYPNDQTFFFQSQACIMLTPRMPLYIPCVYVVFMYTSLIGAWRFKLSALPQVMIINANGPLFVTYVSTHTVFAGSFGRFNG